MDLKSTLRSIDRLQERLMSVATGGKRHKLERRLRKIVSQVFVEQSARVDDWLSDYRHMFTEAGLPVVIEGVLLAILIRAMTEKHAEIEFTLADAVLDGFESAMVVDFGISFALNQDALARTVRELSARMITNISETTRNIIVDILTQGAESRWSYAQTAKAIADKFREFTARAGQRHIRNRAELVAITEIGNAYMQGKLEVGRGLVSSGLAMEKAWLTVGDERVSDGCRANESIGWIDFGQSFPSGHEAPLRFPGCRCALQMRRKG